MPTRNVNLTAELDRLVDEEVRSGRFQNASEVVRAGLRLYEQQRNDQAARLALLHRMLDEADRQEMTPIDDIGAFVDGITAKLDAESAARAARQG
ncbi:type II toxin-antitoxin system ParD family antitoxin [Thalassobaculum sp.]|uniref:type II toxin-antitoxin system ParD family antitoxin n=1 Tax=Thalassobaculum sp. TaxID=2022740 RepID=UPI0032EB80C1